MTAAELTAAHDDCKFRRYEEVTRSSGGELYGEGWKGPSTIWRPTPMAFRKRKLVEPPLLVIDELGGRPDSAASPAHYEIVKYALDLRARRPTIAITNLSRAEMEKYYDARILSRLGSGTLHEMVGEDRRLT